MALLSFVALVIPFIPLIPTLLIPLLAYFFTQLSLPAAWSAWAVGLIGHLFFPAVMARLHDLNDYLLKKRNGEPEQPQKNASPPPSDEPVQEPSESEPSSPEDNTLE